MEPILSICIPIYNRSSYLSRMLERFLEDKDLFEEKVYLYISDNDSEEDIYSIVKSYMEKGLVIHYHRNEENIGGDRNICACYHAGKGKYTWALGSDDILSSGFLRALLPILEEKTYGLVNMDIMNGGGGMKEYTDLDALFTDVNIRMSGISQNIVLTAAIEQSGFEQYVQTRMSQVLLCLKAASMNPVNLVIYCAGYIEDDHDLICDFDPFQVFGEGQLSMFKIACEKGWIMEKTVQGVKRFIYRYFIVGNILTLLILHKKGLCDRKKAWKFVWREYRHCAYAYLYFIHKVATSVWNVIFDKALGLHKLRIKPINVMVE